MKNILGKILLIIAFIVVSYLYGRAFRIIENFAFIPYLIGCFLLIKSWIQLIKFILNK